MPIVDFSLTDQVALVTSASRGIGEAIARGFAEQGATVVLASRKQEGLDKVAESINADGGKAVPIACHAGSVEQIAALFERIDSELGRLDILVNNAATNPYFGPAIDMPEWAFDKTLEVNLKGYFVHIQQAARLMKKQGLGKRDQHRFDRRPAPGAERTDLRPDQGGGAEHDPRLGEGAGPVRHPGQRDRPGRGRDLLRQRPRGYRGEAQGNRQPDAGRPPRPAERDRRRGGVPGLEGGS